MITLFLFAVSLALEIVNLTAEQKPFKNANLVSIINWATCAIFAIMSFCIRKALWGQKLVCPILTVYVFLVVIQSDPAAEMTSAILFTKAMLGTQAVSYILVMFNEAWLINTGIFTLCAAIAALRIEIQEWMDEEMDIHWLILIVLFQVFVYASIGYRTEWLQK